MPIAGSPKKLTQDVADGYLSFSPPMLRNYSPADIKLVLANLALVTRELRQGADSARRHHGREVRNMKLRRLNQAEVVIRAYCTKKRILI